MMKQWFSEFNDEQKNLFLKDLLVRLPRFLLLDSVIPKCGEESVALSYYKLISFKWNYYLSQRIYSLSL